MGAHTSASDAGASWDALEAVDVDQPHGKDYVYSQNIAKGTRKRLNKQHIDFADSTVGGEHTPGCSVVGMEITDDCTAGVAVDGTYFGHGMVWAYSDASNWGVLFCSSVAADSTASTDYTVMKLHPDLQWGSGDVTWLGAHAFHGNVDMSDVDITGSLDVSGDLGITGDFSVEGTADFGGDVAFVNDISVDGTAVFGGDVSIDGTLCCGNIVSDGSVQFGGDVSCSQAAAAWFKADWTTNTVHASYNISGIDHTVDGLCEVSFSSALASADYAVVLTNYDHSDTGVLTVLQCCSQSTTGFRVACKRVDTGAITNADCSEFYGVVYI